MEDIKIGEYVRTKNGLIGKVNKIEEAGSGCRFAGEFLKDEIIEFNDGKIYERRCKREQVTKHSFNLIDLLEVGDYVNGYRIDEIDDWNNLIHKERGINRSGFSIPVAQYNDDITSILTHELYEANCYKVKGE